MPNFANPFQGNVNRKLTKEELIQAVRLDIAGELEAIYLYDAHVQATDDEAEHFISGEGEVKEMLEGLGMKAAGIADDKTEVTNKATTVGSLLDK